MTASSHVALRFDSGEWPLTEANRSLDRKIATDGSGSLSDARLRIACQPPSMLAE
jgi:hypothetical protein